MMRVAEIIQDESAIAALCVAKANHLAQLALFKGGAPGDFLRADA
jgi:hypothetical protein